MHIQTWFVFVFVVFCAACGGSTQTNDDHLCSYPPQADAQVPSEAGDAQSEPEAEAGVDALHEPEARVPTLTVKLNPKAKGSVVNINDEWIQMLWLDLEGDELEDVTTKSLSLTRSEMGQDSSVELGLLDEDYNSLMPPPQDFWTKVDPQTHKAMFQGLKIKVPAKTKISIVIITTFSGKPDEHHALSLAQAWDIITDKGVVQGAFPIQGPTFDLVDGPNYLTQLIYDLPGAVPPGPFTGGAQNVKLLTFEARSVYYEFWFFGWGFDLVALDGGRVRGSKGTFLIKQARMLGNDSNVSDGVFMDPANTDPGAESMSFRFNLPQLAHPIELGCASNKLFDVSVDLAATEDAPGEFFGHKYRLDLHMPVYGNDLYILTFVDLLNPGAVEPKTSLQGIPVMILAP